MLRYGGIVRKTNTHQASDSSDFIPYSICEVSKFHQQGIKRQSAFFVKWVFSSFDDAKIRSFFDMTNFSP